MTHASKVGRLRLGPGLALVGLVLVRLAMAQEPPPRQATAIVADLGAKEFAKRRDAVKACRGRREPVLVDRLFEVAGHDPHPNIRAWAIDELGTRDDARVRPLLLAAIEGETNPFPRQRALVAIGARREAGAFDLLSRHLESHDVAAAIEGLGQLGDRRAFEPVLALLERRRGDWQIAGRAPRALLQLDAKRGRAELLRLFTTANDRAGMGEIAAALRESPDDTVREAMLALLDATDDDQRADLAVMVLGAFRDANTCKRLRAVFEARPAARAACAAALAAAGDRGSASFLASFLAQEEDAGRRRALLEALGTLGEAREAPRVAAALSGETEAINRIVALVALGQLGDRQTLGAVLAHLDDAEVTEQDARLSGIRRFPWNARVGDVAVWAAATLRDGKPPFAVETLSQFPRPAPRQEVERLRGELAKWWRELGEAEKRAWSRPDR